MYSERLPRAGLAREALRQKGQFWTPAWVAEAMVAYAVGGGSDHVFDPAVGAGAFFLAAKAIASEGGRTLTLLGTEIDPDALQQSLRSELTEGDLAHVEITDFVLRPPKGMFKAIVANPPYIRHHRLSSDTKSHLRRFGAELIGTPLDGRAGLHIYFLLVALRLLNADGRLAFIMPADTCEGVFAAALWKWITSNYRLEAVVTFAPEATPFPGVDTNAIIFMIRNAKPGEHFLWAVCTETQTTELKEWALSELAGTPRHGISLCQRSLSEGLATGFSRPPMEAQAARPALGDFARTMRGIATGANEFFFLTPGQAATLGIPDEFLVPAIGRTRDVPGDEISSATLRALEEKGRPTLLFAPDGRPIDGFPPAVVEYLKRGEQMGVNTRPLVSTRCPWYKMEVRRVPPILFAYLGRRNARFIRNVAGVAPLTGFICLYPHRDGPDFIRRLWGVLQHPQTQANLRLVGKSYGAGAIKVEPRALERLPLPVAVMSEIGLELPAEQQPLLL